MLNFEENVDCDINENVTCEGTLTTVISKEPMIIWSKTAVTSWDGAPYLSKFDTLAPSLNSVCCPLRINEQMTQLLGYGVQVKLCVKD